MARIPTRLIGRRPDPATVLVGLLAGAGGVAGSFAVAGFTPAFVAGPVAGFLARTLPGRVLTVGIVVLGDLGSQLNVLAALVLAVLLLGGTSLAGSRLGAAADPRAAGIGAAAATGVLAYAITLTPPASLASGVAAGVVVTTADVVRSRAPAAADVAGRASVRSADRRRVLGALASSLSLVLGGYLLGRGRGAGSTPAPAADLTGPWSAADVDPLLEAARERSLDVEGLEPLVSDQFYEVDINATDPRLDAGSWSLSVTGAVERERAYTYDGILAMEHEQRFVSLRCVGEGLNGKKLDNALWTGVPIMDLVEPAGPAEECCVMLRAADGFFEEFPLPALSDGFLAIGMNGEALPRGHGYPARALIPGHWGEINVKWLTEIEVLEQAVDGYWERRGWHGTGPVNTVAKLHVVNHLDDGRVQVAGHAYAGTRGVDRVEVSTDGGGTWIDATLSEPLPGTDVWRQWVHTYDPPAGSHEVVVRATDGTGALQPREEASPFPNGASGWVSRTIRG